MTYRRGRKAFLRAASKLHSNAYNKEKDLPAEVLGGHRVRALSPELELWITNSGGVLKVKEEERGSFGVHFLFTYGSGGTLIKLTAIQGLYFAEQAESTVFCSF